MAENKTIKISQMPLAQNVQEQDIIPIVRDESNQIITFKILENELIKKIIESGISGSNNDYQELNNKPLINDIELIGNKTSKDLGIPNLEETLTNTDELILDSGNSEI